MRHAPERLLAAPFAFKRARAGAENVDPTGAVPLSRAFPQEAMAFAEEQAAPRFNPTHKLDGFIAYYGRHYFAYWRRAPQAGAAAVAAAADLWDGFDDASVRDAGTWAEVVEKVSEGRLMPLLLFFSSIETAPARVS